MTMVTVIGAGGYAGSHIAEAAVQRNFEVRGMTRSEVAMQVAGVSYERGSILSPEDQAALLEAAKEAGAYNRELSQKADAELRPKLEAAGVQFNEVDKAPFIEATAGIVEAWRGKYPEMVEAITTAAGK